MKGVELKRLRQEMGLSRLELAALIGYTGTNDNNRSRLRQMENGRKEIPLYIARFVWLLAKWHAMFQARAVSVSWPPRFPRWPGYDFEHIPDEEIVS